MAEISNIPRNRLLGWLADSLGVLKEGARAAPPELGGPIIDFLLGEKAKLADDLSYGFPPTRGQGWATTANPEAAELLDFMPNPAGVGAKFAAKTGAKEALPLLAAALRPGGDPTLIAHHSRPFGHIIRGGKVNKETYSPSFAVVRNQLIQDFQPTDGAAGLDLIPRAGAFDPVMDYSTLFNRDGYVARANTYPGRPAHKVPPEAFGSSEPLARDWLAEHASVRLYDRMSKPGFQDWNKFSEFGIGQTAQSVANSGGMSLGHALALRESPAFRSFKHYESSPFGAQILTGSRGAASKVTSQLEDEVGEWLLKWGFGEYPSDIFKAEQTLRSSIVPPEALREYGKLMRAFKQVPARYGELKLHGPVQISPEKFAGFIVYPGEKGLKEAQKLADMGMDAWQIPGMIRHSRENDPFEMAKYIQEQAKAYGGRPMGSAWAENPDNRIFVDNNMVVDKMIKDMGKDN